MLLTTLKIAVLAPIPSASVTIATAVKPGLRASTRVPYFNSPHKLLIQPPVSGAFSVEKASHVPGVARGKACRLGESGHLAGSSVRFWE
jgi:hypothetical protein